jgi:hypothetical protein
MPEPFKFYLDQMLQLDVAEALRGEGHDVIRANVINLLLPFLRMHSYGQFTNHLVINKNLLAAFVYPACPVQFRRTAQFTP